MAESFALELPSGIKWVVEPLAGHQDDEYVQAARVIVKAAGMEAVTIVTLSGGPWDPARFMAGLAADWRGWDGKRIWKALEGEMEIEASHDGSRVLISVTVRRPDMTFAEDAWCARIAFTLEPGEQLAGVARDLEAALSLQEQRRRSSCYARMQGPARRMCTGLHIRQRPAHAACVNACQHDR
jgi:Family of unknown function (DUF6228)